MKIIQKNIEKLDRFQRRHKLTAFSYAVVKKYGEDEAGYKAALLTYYAFLSLFPLLLVLVTLTTYVDSYFPDLQTDVVQAATDYFPVLGQQIADHISGLNQTGPALIVALLFTFYGARGVGAAFQHGVQHIWGIPKVKRPGFPQSTTNSLLIILVGGLGLIVAAISTGIAASSGPGVGYNLLAALINVIILSCIFTFLINICLPHKIALNKIGIAAVVAAVGLVALQNLGGRFLTGELRTLDALYSYFALSLGLLFWIYLQVQIILFAVEIAAVSDKSDWPRSLSGKNLTSSDKRAAERQLYDY